MGLASSQKPAARDERNGPHPGPVSVYAAKGGDMSLLNFSLKEKGLPVFDPFSSYNDFSQMARKRNEFLENTAVRPAHPLSPTHKNPSPSSASCVEGKMRRRSFLSIPMHRVQAKPFSFQSHPFRKEYGNKLEIHPASSKGLQPSDFTPACIEAKTATSGQRRKHSSLLFLA